MSGSFVERAITVTVTLGTGALGQSGFNTVALAGLRCLTTVQKGTYPSMDHCSVRIYGVPPSIANAVSTLGVALPMVRGNNAVLIEAGDAVNGMAVVYNGYLSRAWMDYNEAPETALMIEGWGGMEHAIEPMQPISIQGAADVATLMQSIAGRMGWAFENSGVTVKLSNQYLCGSALKQVHDLARAANIEAYPDTSTNPVTLAIWPKTGTRGGAVPLISAASGLVGYPNYSSQGMTFRTLFNPSIRLAGQIQMQSSVGGAATTVNGSNLVPDGTQSGGPNGSWYVIGPLVHDLSAQVPGGPWFTDVNCARVNVPGGP